MILGGDISADRTTSIAADMALYQPLYDRGIAFIAGFGNHDWESPWYADANSPAGQAATTRPQRSPGRPIGAQPRWG